MLRSFPRRYLIALSFVNLCYAEVWKSLFDVTRPSLFHTKTVPGPGVYLAAICGVLLGALLVVALDALLRTIPRIFRACALAAAVAFMMIRGHLLFPDQFIPRSWLSSGHTPAYLILGVVSAIVVGLFIRYQQAVSQSVVLVLLICSPFCAFTLGDSLYNAARTEKLQDRPLAPRFPRRPGPRVLWVIFDEWDQRITFDTRPSDLAMPNADRLLKESIFAENAMPPAGKTLVSMPSLIYGHKVRSEQLVGPDTLMVTYDDGKTTPFGAKPNIFAEVRAAGMNAAIAGWYLPYCRVLNPYITDCWWQEIAFPSNSSGKTFGGAFLNQPRSLLETLEFSPWGQPLPIVRQVRTFEETFRRSKRLASDDNVQFALFHFNVPHPPSFYNPNTGQLTGGSFSAYTKGVALVDRIIGELRTTMEQSGAWNTTTLLLSSDHFYRSSPLINGKRDRRVPFIVHLPGQTAGITYTHSFNTVVTHDFILALLRSELSDPASVQHWLDRHNGD